MSNANRLIKFVELQAPEVIIRREVQILAREAVAVMCGDVAGCENLKEAFGVALKKILKEEARAEKTRKIKKESPLNPHRPDRQ